MIYVLYWIIIGVIVYLGYAYIDKFYMPWWFLLINIIFGPISIIIFMRSCIKNIHIKHKN